MTQYIVHTTVWSMVQLLQGGAACANQGQPLPPDQRSSARRPSASGLSVGLFSLNRPSRTTDRPLARNGRSGDADLFFFCCRSLKAGILPLSRRTLSSIIAYFLPYYDLLPSDSSPALICSQGGPWPVSSESFLACCQHENSLAKLRSVFLTRISPRLTVRCLPITGGSAHV